MMPRVPPPSRLVQESQKSGHIGIVALKILQCVVTMGLLWWLFRDPSRRGMMLEALQRADWRWLLAAFTSAGFCEFFGILRWQLFLRMLHVHIPFAETARLFFIGAFFNQFLPGTTGGDVVRVVYLMREHPEHKTAGFLSVAVDRLWALLVLMGMGLVFAWTRSAWFAQSLAIGNAMKVFAIILVAIGGFLAASFFLTKRHLVERLPAGLPFREKWVKLSTLWQLCIENRVDSFLGAFYTIPMLLSYFGAFYFVAQAFTAKVSLIDMVSIMPLVTAVSALPISLNGMGVREALFEQLLHELCGVSQGAGVLISITGMIIYLAWGLPGGWFYMKRNRSTQKR
jgi:hypothetical protein